MIYDEDLVARFASKFLIDDDCWPWTASKDSKGYGQIRFNGRTLRAHRVAYELLRGQIEGMQLDHLCRVRHCVNPAHLEPVTNQENSWRAARTKPCPHGHRAIRNCAECRARLARERRAAR